MHRKILIDEEVVKQALDAIGSALSDDKPYLSKCRSSYAAIESALDGAEKVEPVDKMYSTIGYAVLGKYANQYTGNLEISKFDIPLICKLFYAHLSHHFAAPTPPTNTYTAIHRYTGTGEGPPPIPPLDGGMVITKEIKPKDELREAARAVVEWWCDNGGDPLDIRIDRLRKALK